MSAYTDSILDGLQTRQITQQKVQPPFDLRNALVNGLNCLTDVQKFLPAY